MAVCSTFFARRLAVLRIRDIYGRRPGSRLWVIHWSMRIPLTSSLSGAMMGRFRHTSDELPAIWRTWQRRPEHDEFRCQL
jgi:hypothetical protein